MNPVQGQRRPQQALPARRHLVPGKLGCRHGIRVQPETDACHGQGYRRGNDLIAAACQRGNGQPGNEERKRQFAHADCKQRDYQPCQPPSRSRKRERQRHHQTADQFVRERDLGNECSGTEQRRQRSCGVAFAARHVRTCGSKPCEDIRAPQYHGHDPPAQVPPQGGPPGKKWGPDRDERFGRIGKFPISRGSRGIVIGTAPNPRMNIAIEVHIDTFAAFQPLLDISFVRRITRLESKTVPHAGDKCRKQQRQRGPARQQR